MCVCMCVHVCACVCVCVCVVQSKGYMKGWDGRLGKKAEIILLKHTELSGISSLHEKCM